VSLDALPTGMFPDDDEEQLRVPKASEIVAVELRRRIVRGELKKGESLPPEPELMRQFHVSRPTLREAFRILESERFITVRRGARGGARIHLPDPTMAAQYAGLLLRVRGATLGMCTELVCSSSRRSPASSLSSIPSRRSTRCGVFSRPRRAWSARTPPGWPCSSRSSMS
jgi:DNA-binding GntR family transcriptional regulator